MTHKQHPKGTRFTASFTTDEIVACVVVGTTLNNSGGEDMLRAQGLIDETGRPVIDSTREKKTLQQSESTSVIAATIHMLVYIGNIYLKGSNISVIDDTWCPIIVDEVTPYSVDQHPIRRLRDLREQMLEA